MLKKIAIPLLLAIIFALAIFPTGQQAEAASTTYTFVKANYNETEDKEGKGDTNIKKCHIKK